MSQTSLQSQQQSEWLIDLGAPSLLQNKPQHLISYDIQNTLQLRGEQQKPFSIYSSPETNSLFPSKQQEELFYMSYFSQHYEEEKEKLKEKQKKDEDGLSINSNSIKNSGQTQAEKALTEQKRNSRDQEKDNDNRGNEEAEHEGYDQEADDLKNNDQGGYTLEWFTIEEQVSKEPLVAETSRASSLEKRKKKRAQKKQHSNRICYGLMNEKNQFILNNLADTSLVRIQLDRFLRQLGKNHANCTQGVILSAFKYCGLLEPYQTNVKAFYKWVLQQKWIPKWAAQCKDVFFFELEKIVQGSWLQDQQLWFLLYCSLLRKAHPKAIAAYIEKAKLLNRAIDPALNEQRGYHFLEAIDAVITTPRDLNFVTDTKNLIKARIEHHWTVQNL